MIRLTLTQVIRLHEELIRETGGLSGIRSESMLDSALNSPFQALMSIHPFNTKQPGLASVSSKIILLLMETRESGPM